MSLLAVTSGDIASGVVEAEGVDFDGVSDYLSRSTDLVGNVDSKQFTFSALVYVDGSGNVRVFSSKNGTYRNNLVFNNGSLVFTGKNTVGTSVLNVTTPISINTFIHYIISCDLSNTSKRYVCINDINTTSTWSIYLNQSIKFTAESHVISADEIGVVASLKNRLSNIFLDYVYRDLSIEANRRLFITADGKPTPTATLKALNPILYLPMKDAATAHINEGTGGNFTLNGTIATSERGANQDNCVASKFDGVDDALWHPTNFATTDSGKISFSFILNNTDGLNKYTLFVADRYLGGRVYIQSYISSSNALFELKNSSNTTVVKYTPSFTSVSNRSYAVTVSFDLSDTNKRSVYINGKQDNGVWNTYSIGGIVNLVLGSDRRISIGADYYNSLASFFNGSIGELYFDTRYTNLATSNPFWDADTNRPKPVRQVIRETGITPLIAMPLDASNPGKNYGSGGDFTANSAPYVGARGASEFWARSAKFDGSTGYLSRGALTGVADTKTFSIAFSIDINISNTDRTFFGLSEATNGYRLYCRKSSTNELNFIGVNSANALVLNITTSTGGSYTAGSGSKVILASFDLANNLKGVYVNGVSNAITVTTFTNGFIDLASILYSTIGAQSNGSDTMSAYFNGNIAIGYFTTDYIDFSQEVNRLKFVDGLGFPKDLKAQIDAGVIPKPLFYLPFDDPTNLGKDASGNNNHFTVNGTVTSGSDVLG